LGLRGERGVPTWVDPATDRGHGHGHGGGHGQGGGHDQGPDAGGPVGRSTRLQAAASRALAIALWATLGLALLLGLVNCARITVDRAAPAPPPPSPQPVAPPGGCAELVVAGWVAGDDTPLDGAGGTARSGSGDRSRSDLQRLATRTYITAVTAAAAPDRWGYLVAAQVAERDRDTGQWDDLGLHYFTVTMVEAGGGCQGWRAAAPPMQVAAPTGTGDVPLPYPITLASGGTQLAVTLEAFFRGLLAGGGDMERYLAPGSSIPPVTPPPYGEVSVTELRAWPGSPVDRADRVPPDGTTVRLLVTVSADRAPLPLAYPVTVAVRGGRWEVVAIDPLVAAPQPEAGPPATVDNP
jgi:hypothetical protein